MADGGKSRVIVSGAGGALGAALARRYLAAGRPVLALDMDAARLAELGAHPLLVTAAADLADADAVQGALDSALGRDKAALLVNAVGLIWNEPVLAMKGARLAAHDAGTFERVLRANLTAAFVTASRTAARMARGGGGVIVNFSSVAAQGNAGQAAYSAAKAGVEGMTRAMAQELGPLGVRVNAVAPGFIDVPTTRGALAENVLADYARRTPLRRLGAVEELALAIDAIEANGFLNGVILPLDGGLRL